MKYPVMNLGALGQSRFDDYVSELCKIAKEYDRTRNDGERNLFMARVRDYSPDSGKQAALMSTVLFTCNLSKTIYNELTTYIPRPFTNYNRAAFVGPEKPAQTPGNVTTPGGTSEGEKPQPPPTVERKPVITPGSPAAAMQPWTEPNLTTSYDQAWKDYLEKWGTATTERPNVETGPSRLSPSEARKQVLKEHPEYASVASEDLTNAQNVGPCPEGQFRPAQGAPCRGSVGSFGGYGNVAYGGGMTAPGMTASGLTAGGGEMTSATSFMGSRFPVINLGRRR